MSETMTFTEAPVSFNVKASYQGYDVMLTVRDTDTKRLMDRAIKTLEWLQEHGFEPTARQNGSNGAQKAVQTPVEPPTLPDGTPDPAWCPIHHVAMKRREKDGQVWYSHKAPDGTWCRGKV